MLLLSRLAYTAAWPWFAAVLVFSACGGGATGPMSSELVPEVATLTQPCRAIVKLAPRLAREMEASLPTDASRLYPSADSRAISAVARAFFARHRVSSIVPVHRDVVRKKKAGGLTDRQLAWRAVERYPERARRAIRFRPPVLSTAYLVDLDTSTRSIDVALSQLRDDIDVEYADLERRAQITLTTNDPYLASNGSWGQGFDDLYGVHRIRAPAAWDTAQGANVVVAVIDTGVDLNHPELASRLLSGWNFVADTDDPSDDHGHGTHVAGTIAAVGNNGTGVVGVAWQAQILPIKALDHSGFGYEAALAQALRFAADHGADVINNSWGSPGTSPVFQDAVDYAKSLGCVVVAAAGNDSQDAALSTPSNIAGVITVAAADAGDVRSRFSNWGSKIDVAAPGADILSLRAAGTSLGRMLGEHYAIISGTSMAAPHVSAAAAVVLSVHPTFGPEQVRQVLRSSADDLGPPGFDSDFGYGMLRVDRALGVNSPLAVKILSPKTEAGISGSTTIVGTVAGEGLASFVLEYGVGRQPTSWTRLAEGTAAVVGDEIAGFDTTHHPDGPYTLRLSAIGSGAQAYSDHVVLRIRYIEITAPRTPASSAQAHIFGPDDIVTIVGTATGPSFVGYSIEWGTGEAPGVWSSAGVSVSGGGVTPISDDSLATLDASALPEDGYYTVRVRVQNTGFVSEARTAIYRDTDADNHRRLTLDSEPQLFATVSGTRVAYMDYRLGDSAIFVLDLTTGIETQISDTGFVSPHLDGDRLIFRDMADGGLGPLVLYDLTTNIPRPITSHQSFKGAPFIRGNSVVWHEERSANWDVYHYDIGSNVERRITTDPASDADAKIDGQRIVFNSNRRGSYEVYLYDLDVGTETLLAPNGRLQGTPSIEGNLVAWREPINAIFNIIVFDIATEERRQITPGVGIYNNGSQARVPVISGNLIVWTDFRDSVAFPPENGDIYLFNLETNEESQVTSRLGTQNSPAIAGASVIYTDNRSGDWDIYLSAPELSATPDAVETGGSTTVSWRVPPGQASTGDRIGLFVTGAPRDSVLNEESTDGGSTGTLTFALPTTSGAYEFRYLAGENDGCRSNSVTVNPCADAATKPCYSGPPETQGVGLCRAGTRTCSGGVWGDCSGEVTPATDLCDGRDSDCDGTPDSGCPCSANDARECYAEPSSTRDTLPCHPGTQECLQGAWGPCVGQQRPELEDCTDGVDNDCDGYADEEDAADCARELDKANRPLEGCSCRQSDTWSWFGVAIMLVGLSSRARRIRRMASHGRRQ